MRMASIGLTSAGFGSKHEMMVLPAQTRFFGVSVLLHALLLAALLFFKTGGIPAPIGQDVYGELTFLDVGLPSKAPQALVKPKLQKQVTKQKPVVAPKPLEGDVATKTVKQASQESSSKPVEAQPAPADAARFGTADGTATTGRMGRSDGQEVVERDRYIYELRAAIETQKVFPQISQRMREMGRVTVQFRINREGQFADVKVAKPCAFERLNDAALKLVSGVGRFKPLPSEIKDESLTVDLPIDYSLANRTHLGQNTSR